MDKEMVSPKHLAHLVLRVRDLGKAEKFYTEVLGLKVSSRDFGMVFLRAAANRSHELALAPSKEVATPITDSPRFGLSHFAWRVGSIDDLRKMYRQLRTKGVEISGTGDHGISLGIYFLDPDGNRVEVFYELPQKDWPSEQLFTGKFPMSLDE